MRDKRKIHTKVKLIAGVGVNDADYPVTRSSIIDGKTEQVWLCPYYSVWKGMLGRCYSNSAYKNIPAYRECSVDISWHKFSNFKAWMEKQDWEGLQIDKDLLCYGNKVYSASTCVFISTCVNQFIRDHASGEWPIGVHWVPDRKRFQAGCNNPFTGKREHLGTFSCPDLAHKAWLDKKTEYAIQLAAVQSNRRVAIALIDRYLNYVHNSCTLTRRKQNDLDSTSNA